MGLPYRPAYKGAEAISDITKGLVKCVLAVGIVIALPKPSAPHINNLEVSAQPIAVKQQVAAESKPQVKKATKVKEKAKPKKQKPTPKPKVVERPPVEVPKSKEALLAAAGIPESDWQAVDYIVSKESSWRHDAVNAGSGATGLCQSLPATKMASEGEDYMTNPVTQLRWCHKYAVQRYGGWWGAHAFWLQNAWW